MRAVRVMLLAVLLASCSGDSTGPRSGPDGPINPTGAVTATIGAGGGTVTAVADDGARITLTFPAGAVRAPTAVTVRPLEPGGHWLQAALEPAGTVFRRPFTIAVVLPEDTDLRDPVLTIGGSDVRLPLATTADPAPRRLASTALAFFGFADGAIPAGGAFSRLAGRMTEGNVIGAGPMSCDLIVATAQAELDGYVALGLHERAVGAALSAQAALQQNDCVDAEEFLAQAAVAACDGVAVTVQELLGNPITGHGDFRQRATRVLDWYALVQRVGATDCAATADMLTALETAATAFVAFVGGALAAVPIGGYDAYQDVKDEARDLRLFEAAAYQLGLPGVAELVDATAFKPVIGVMRTAAYAYCRDDGWHYPLSRLTPAGFHAARDMVGVASPRPGQPWPPPGEYAGITADAIAHDLQYCGTELTIDTRDPDGDAIGSARAGGDGAPALATADVTLPAPRTGTISISGDLAGFTCWDGSAADAAIRVELAGTAVHTIARTGTAAYLGDGPVELDVATIADAAGIEPVSGASADLVLRRVRTACDSTLWGPEEFELVHATLEWTGHTVYEEDFDVGAAGAEWSSTGVTTSPTGVQFLGVFAQHTVTLTLDALPAHGEVTITFDLYIIDDWNGNRHPDAMVFRIDGDAVLTTTFSNSPEDEQAYPDAYPGGANPALTGAAATETIGINLDGDEEGITDATYRITLTAPHTAGSVSFGIEGDPSSPAEGWGLDNVRVSVSD